MKIFIEYIESINKHYPLTIIDTIEEVCIKPVDSIWLLQHIHHPENIDVYTKYPKQCVLLNFEQCSQDYHLARMKTYSHELRIIDYSLGNMRYIQHPNYFHVPYMVNPDEIFDYEKTSDVIIIAGPGEKRAPMAKTLGATYVGGWGYTRDNELFRHKILVNIHAYSDRTILEELRINRCIFNKMIVITEPCENTSLYDLRHYVIECEYDNIPKVVEAVLKNYETYYNQIFGKFDIIDICKRQKNHIDSFITQLAATKTDN